MTNREYIAALLFQFEVEQTTIDAILESSELVSGETANKLKCKEAIYSNLLLWFNTKDVSDGSLSIKSNIEALKLWFSNLCNELNKPNPFTLDEQRIKPKAKSISNRW